jgi:hypothetical protein
LKKSVDSLHELHGDHNPVPCQLNITPLDSKPIKIAEDFVAEIIEFINKLIRAQSQPGSGSNSG